MKSMKSWQIISNLYHPKTGEKQQQLQIFCKYLKKVKDLSYLLENLGEALGYLTNIRRILQGAALKESAILLEPTKAESRGKMFSSFALPSKKKKDRNIGQLNYLRNTEM